MLGQAGIAKKGSAFPVWVRGQGVIRLQVASCTPADLVRLVEDAEVIIAPCLRPRLDGSQPLVPAKLPPGTSAQRRFPRRLPEPISWLRTHVGFHCFPALSGAAHDLRASNGPAEDKLFPVKIADLSWGSCFW